jgi:hypothetical protein
MNIIKIFIGNHSFLLALKSSNRFVMLYLTIASDTNNTEYINRGFPGSVGFEPTPSAILI